MGRVYRRHYVPGGLYQAAHGKCPRATKTFLAGIGDDVFYFANRVSQSGRVGGGHVVGCIKNGTDETEEMEALGFETVSYMFASDYFLYLVGKRYGENDRQVHVFDPESRGLIAKFTRFGGLGREDIDFAMGDNTIGWLSSNGSRDSLLEIVTLNSADGVPHSAHYLTTEDYEVLGMANNVGVLASRRVVSITDLDTVGNGEILKTVDGSAGVDPTAAAFNSSSEAVAIGYVDGSVKLWDTRYFTRPFYVLKSEAYRPGAVKSLAFSDYQNELYVARQQVNRETPWIESFSTADMASYECLIEPQIPLLPQSERYLDHDAVWPPGSSVFELPDQRVAFEDPHPYVSDLRKQPVFAGSMLVKRNKLFVGTPSSVLSIDIPKMRSKKSYSLIGL